MADPAGAQLADEIAGEIRAARMKPGMLVASEQDLRAHHDIGRSVLRQAVRILEERGVAFMRRGSGGGLIVAAPNPESAGRALAIAIESRMLGPTALDRLLKAADTHVFLVATPKLDMAACERVRRLVSRLGGLSNAEFERVGGIQQLVVAIRGMVQDPLAGLAYQTTAEYGQDLAPYGLLEGADALRGAWWEALLQMIEAQIAGDIGALFALRRRQQDLMADGQKAWSAIDRDHRQLPAIEGGEAETTAGSPAERLAREILRDVRLLGWVAGERIGGAAELMQRYQVTVGTLRQAVRILEEHAAVRMERGRTGGLVITAPDLSQAVRRALQYLSQTQIDAADARFFLQQLVLEALSAVAGRRPDLADLTAATTLGQRLRAIGRLSGDAGLEAFIDVVTALGADQAAPPAPVALLDALRDGDGSRARRVFLNDERG